MADLTWQDVEAIAPELTDSVVPPTTQATLLAFVNSLDGEAWGGEGVPAFKTARQYLAAHMGTLASRGDGAAGPVTSMKEGPLSVQFAAASPMGTDPMLDTTNYGKMYRWLVRNTLGGPRAI